MERRESEILKGSRLRPLGRRPQTATKVRTCSAFGCCTQLSRYNTAETCYVHRPLRFPRVRGVTA